MRVLMFGWEFPPFKSGGLGTACQGMATALAKKGTEIFFVLPRAESDRPVHLQDGLTMLSASGTRICTRSSRLRREEGVRESRHDRPHTEQLADVDHADAPQLDIVSDYLRRGPIWTASAT